MDPVNLSDAQSTPLNCKCNACTRNPAGCSCCGLSDYPKNIPPAYCFATLYPGIPSCKHCQDHLPDNFTIPHSYFPSFPFQQQLFHSALIPPNVYCSQKLLNDESARQGQTQSEHETLHRPAKKERTAFSAKSSTNEAAQKNKQNLRSDTSLPYYNEMESQFNPACQRCVCGDSIPRPCSPFIMPVFSYCLVWNSQAPCQNLLSKSFSNYLTETLCQKNSENLAGKIYSNETQEKLNVVKEPEMVKMTADSNRKAPEVAHYEKESLPVRKLGETDLKKAEHAAERGDVNRGTSTTALPSGELKCHEEISSKSTEQEEVTECLENVSDETDEEELSEDETESGDDIEMKEQTDSEESLAQDETDAANDSPLPESNTNPWKSGEYDTPLARHSSSDFKSTAKSSELSVVDSLSEHQTNVWPAGVADTNPEMVSNEASEERNSEDEEADISKACLKKCIKNFTVTNEISGDPTEKEQKSTAAAGDLGGEGCCDHIKKISKPNDAQPEKPIPEKCESNDLRATSKENEERKQEKVSDKNPGENLDENQNSGLKYKSGIAKLLHNPNSKTFKANVLKNTKNCKNDSNQKQISLVKHKHCCFPSDTTNSLNENRYKIQKTKNIATVQRPSFSSERQHKSPTRSQLVKKGTPQKTLRPMAGLPKS